MSNPTVIHPKSPRLEPVEIGGNRSLNRQYATWNINVRKWKKGKL